jgi:hypothetical protein
MYFYHDKNTGIISSHYVSKEKQTKLRPYVILRAPPEGSFAANHIRKERSFGLSPQNDMSRRVRK